MGKGFIYQIDNNGTRLGNNIDVYSEIMTSSKIFTGDKTAFKSFNIGDIFYYSDDDMEALSGKFEVEFCFNNKITGKKIK